MDPDGSAACIVNSWGAPLRSSTLRAVPGRGRPWVMDGHRGWSQASEGGFMSLAEKPLGSARH